MQEIQGRKLNMSQIFLESGKVVPVTVIDCELELHNGVIDSEVAVTGTSKGKGFAGVMKKWGFKGGPATGGQKHDARKPGSIGAQTPGKVFKGKKMAGRLGNEKVTVTGLRIVKLMSDKHKIMVSGPIPGARNSKVLIRLSKPIEEPVDSSVGDSSAGGK
ncbi:50S ribosomal protein L3 [Patescibacteria group bacterium]|nr:50S ribosomal protein L3 [Patescibacteria group bacterium]